MVCTGKALDCDLKRCNQVASLNTLLSIMIMRKIVMILSKMEVVMVVVMVTMMLEIRMIMRERRRKGVGKKRWWT